MDHDTRGFDHRSPDDLVTSLQEELRLEKEKFKHMFDANPQPMIIYDVETLKFIAANQAALKFYGYEREEIYNLSILDVRPPEDLNLIKKHLAQPELPTNAGVWRHKKKNGEIIYVNIVAHDIIINGRRARYATTTDVTRQVVAENQMKEMMAELIQAKLKAEESDRLKTAFLANMSHEIRTPMNGILGFMDLLQQPDVSGEERNEYIQLVKSSGNRLMNTIKDIIDISKIEAGATEVMESTFNINNLVIGQCNFFKPEADRKQIHLTVTSLIPSLSARIKSDHYKVESIVINLIKNAIKFTSQGSIEIDLSIHESMLVIKVSDTGRGISEEKLTEIFEPFVQAGNTYAREYEGSGLGLSICRSYARLLGGNITVVSEPWKGSVFTVSIPYKCDRPGEELHTSADTPEVPETIPAKVSILLAEDDEISYQYFKSVVSRLNITLVRAVNGQEAISLLDAEKGNFSMVFMDIKMPVLDGLEATRRIRQRYPNLPVIALTAYSLSHDEARIKQAGCSDYLSKPVKKELVMKMIAKWAIKG